MDGQAKTIQCSSGRTYGYDDIVLAPGLVPDEAALAGVATALDTPAVASNYLDHAENVAAGAID